MGRLLHSPPVFFNDKYNIDLEVRWKSKLLHGTERPKFAIMTTTETISTRTAYANLVGDDVTDLFPNGGWDTHHHIFEPEEFAYCPNRHLTPPPATVEAYLAFKKNIGITRSVLTHGLSYGNDCTSLKAFVPRLGTPTTKAMAVFDPEIASDEDLLSMQAAGIRGARLNLYAYHAHDDVNLQKVALQAHVDALTRLQLPWSLTMTPIRSEFWIELLPFVKTRFAGPGLQLITDHFALLKAPSMLPAEYKNQPESQPGFKAIMDLVRGGHLWVKLSAPYRVSELGPHYPDLKFLVRALLDANPDRILWGSDWPHTPRMKVRTQKEALTEAPYLEVDDEAWLRTLRSWTSDNEWDQIMVRNPSTLFG